MDKLKKSVERLLFERSRQLNIPRKKIVEWALVRVLMSTELIYEMQGETFTNDEHKKPTI